MGLDQLFKGRAGGSAKGKCFNNIISTISTVCPMWTDGNDVGRQGKGPDFESGHNLFLFASFLFYFFFSLSVLFSFCFVSLYSLKFFRFINFLPHCLILPFSRSPLRCPAIYVFLVASCNFPLKESWNLENVRSKQTQLSISMLIIVDWKKGYDRQKLLILKKISLSENSLIWWLLIWWPLKHSLAPMGIGGGGGVLRGFKWRGWSNGRKNQNSKKSLNQKFRNS